MNIKTYRYDSDSLNELANQIRYWVINSLVNEKILTKEQATLYNHTHFVTISEKRVLFPWFKKAKDTVNIYVSKLPFKVNDITEDEDDQSDKN